MKQRSKQHLDPNILRPCSHVELCRTDEAKACANCYEMFWRFHGEPSAEEIEAAFQAAQDEEKSWTASSLF